MIIIYFIICYYYDLTYGINWDKGLKRNWMVSDRWIYQKWIMRKKIFAYEMTGISL